MAELESVIENRLISQLCEGNSQWTYRPDIRNEEQLWQNFRYILEQNNKAKLRMRRLELSFRGFILMGHSRLNWEEEKK